MKLCSKIFVVVGALAVIALALPALAGHFTGNGFVYPWEGCTDETTFHYYVTYQLDPLELPPPMYLHIYKGGEMYMGAVTMGVALVDGNLVYYEGQTTLGDAGTDYSFKFWTLSDETDEEYGPQVKDC
ncbi:MAG: hypothetical protein JW759_06980 [Candidatus Coatesbacteria bacterium]|nr:hypothetical protein [Candidatus Coatesbacteria bacterium]